MSTCNQILERSRVESNSAIYQQPDLRNIQQNAQHKKVDFIAQQIKMSLLLAKFVAIDSWWWEAPMAV